MHRLLLKFRIHLEEDYLSPYFRHHGPLFHRWLPNGEEDAIVLPTGNPKVRLKVWFDRRGFVDGGFIKFDSKRKEVDLQVMARQGKLDAGLLRGLLEIQGASEDELSAVRENKVGDDLYTRLGKKVLKLLCPHVSRFVDILRTNYGQYWLREVPKWDSRSESLGSYCSSLVLQWSLDGGNTWRPFAPEKLVRTIVVPRSNFPEYLTKEDWRCLSEAVSTKYEPPLAAFVLSRANEFLREGNLRYALIEGVTALEVVLHQFIEQKLQDSGALISSMLAFWQLPLRTQLTSVAASVGTIPIADLEKALSSIEKRHRVVHNGWSPTDEAETDISGLLRTVAALLPGPRFKFPIYYPSGNTLYPPVKEKAGNLKG